MPLWLITSAAGLRGVYGDDGYQSILAKISALTALGGITFRILDDADSMQGAPPAKSADAAALRAAWILPARQLGA